MSQPYLGQIEAFPYGFVPRNWQACQGQLLAITQNQALFSLLGVTYGGDGIRTFGLPDMRGRVAMGQGSGAGLTPRIMGEQVGEVNHTLLSNEMPIHTHSLNASTVITSNVDTPGPTVALAGATVTNAGATTPMNLYTPQSAGAATPLAPTAIGTTTGGQPHNNMMPYLPLQFCISMSGVFPSRN